MILGLGVLLLTLSWASPGSALMCHSCSSDTEETCATLRDTSSWADRDCLGLCAAWVEGTVTKRGCDDEVPLSTNPAPLLCDRDLCNGFVYPPERLRCRHISGSPLVGDLWPCSNYVEQDDECFVSVESETTAYRGCVSDDPQTPGKLSCDRNEFCQTGPQNDQPTFAPSSLYCVQCSQADPNCASEKKATLCSGNVLLGRVDQCFTIQRPNEILRGCLVTGNNEATCSSAGASCERCGNSGCNDKSFFSSKCIQCSSSSAAECRDNPGASLSVSCVSPENNVECFLQHSGDVVTRGCLNSLLSASQTTCRAGTSGCKVCEGDNCNLKRDFQRCITCDSRECVAGGASLPSTQCPNYLDTCFERVVDSRTVRGCLSPSESCSGSGCRSCPSDNCNTQVIPANRLRCASCRGVECISQPGNPQVCERYFPNDECFVVVKDFALAIRGCVSDDSYSADCFGDPFCQKGATNSQTGIRDSSRECFKCDTEGQPRCMTGEVASRCTTRILLGREEDQCFTLKTDHTLEKGCLMEADNQQRCSGPLCKTCTADRCNSEVYFESKCIKCSSFGSESCASSPALTQSISCINEELDDSCFLEVQGSFTRRGCSNELSSAERQVCENGDGSCKVCKGENCNLKQGFQRCFECDSVSNPSCATLSSPLELTVCPGYSDRCFERVNGGRTSRGCLSPSDTCSSGTCLDCFSNGCNGLIFPRDRLICKQCRDDDTCAQSSTSLTGLPCPIYDPRDSCFETLDPQTKTIHRGCSSDNSPVCTAAREKCLKCLTSNCNSNPAVRNPVLRCIQCGLLDVPCPWGFSANSAETCKTTVFLGDQEQCFFRPPEKGLVARGCSNDVEFSVCGNGSCEFCSTNGCNGASTVQQSCLVCDSQVDRSCLSPTPRFSQVCEAEPQEYQNRGCLTIRRGPNRVVRACYVDQSDEERLFCEQSPSQCDRCLEQDCNAGASKFSFYLILPSLLLVLCMIIR